jgi:hypothetical protein
LAYSGQTGASPIILSQNILSWELPILTSYLANTSEFLDLSEMSTLFLNAFEDRSVMLVDSLDVPWEGCAILEDGTRLTAEVAQTI